MNSGSFMAQKKDGSIYYRSSITYKNKHISLGSFQKDSEAHQAYLTASLLLASDQSISDYPNGCLLPFDKWVSLVNFRDHKVYFKTPIYLKKNYFQYHFSPTEIFTFDIDDLFFYSVHRIQKRNGHYFTADYGMQLTLNARYGIRSYAVKDRDYRFINGDSHDFRYENIEIINRYYGVIRLGDAAPYRYQTKIHLNGNIIVGTYLSEEQAAIAYNKAVDVLRSKGIHKNYPENYIDSLSPREYADLYVNTEITKAL